MTVEDVDDFERLHGLIAGTEDIKGFLDGMTGFAAAMMTRVTGARIECAVTLRRRKRGATIAGSSDDAILLDGIEQNLGEGPFAEALRTGVPVLLADVSAQQDWPEYCRSLASAGCRSSLGVPLRLGEDAAAALVFFAPATGLFTEETIADASLFADMGSRALSLAIRIATADLLAENLRAALDGRTAIDVACGVIMAQNHCSQDEAFEMLRKASSTRNQKLHALAEEVIARLSGTNGTATHFEA